jgi:hypothetical protein
MKWGERTTRPPRPPAESHAEEAQLAAYPNNPRGSTHMSTKLPQIGQNGYELCAVETFLENAPDAHIKRYRRDCIGNGGFIIWDPNDDENGYMVCGRSVAELNAAFLEHFDGFLSTSDEG